MVAAIEDERLIRSMRKCRQKSDHNKFIESWFNRKGRHSALVNLTVEEFWEQYEMSKDLDVNVA